MTKQVNTFKSASSGSSASLAKSVTSGGTQPTIDGTPATNAWSGLTTATVTVSTTSASKILLVLLGYEHPTGTTIAVSSVTSPGLSFTHYANIFNSGANGANSYIDVWWAPLSGALSSAVVTATFSPAFDDMGITAFGVIHANPSTPFDDGGSTGLPALAAAAGAEITTPTLTAAAKDLLICIQGKATSGLPGTPTSFTSIATNSNSAGVKFWFDRTASLGAPTGFSGTVTSSGLSGTPGCMAVLALVAD